MTFNKICRHESFLVKRFGQERHYFVVSEIYLHLFASKVYFVCVLKQKEMLSFLARKTGYAKF